jgi:hypothetical protein
MGPRQVYEVQVTRFLDRWYIEVPAFDILTDCQHLSEVENSARASISGALDVDLNTFGIAIELQPAWDGALREGA